MSILLLVLCVAAGAQSLWGCGDGYVDYAAAEECDPGLRCVLQNNTLAWSGAGAPQSPIQLIVDFKYGVLNYAAPNQSMPVYGLQIFEGPTAAMATLQPVTVEYVMWCVDANGDAQLTLETASASPSTAVIQWTYANITCAAYFAASPAQLSNFSLSAFYANWTGSPVSLTWSLQDVVAPSPAYAMSPNTYCGTTCCFAWCVTTCPGYAGYACTDDAAPSIALVNNASYICEQNGTCMPGVQDVQLLVPSGCGNGIVDPGEECDSGMYCISQKGTSGPRTVAFSFKYVPSGTAIYDYVLTDLTGPGSTPIPIGNNTYFWNCSMPGPTTLRLGVTPGPAYVAPAVYMAWDYTVPGGTNCSNYDWLLAGYSFQQFFAAYEQFNGTTIYFNSTSNSQKLNNLYCGTLCCSRVCHIRNTGSLCPDDTPVTWPQATGYVCSAGICGPPSTATATLTPTPTPTSIPTATPSPSVNASAAPTINITATPSPSVNASAAPTVNITATPSPSVNASAAPTVNITATPSPSVNASITASPTSLPTATASSTLLPTTTATPSPSTRTGTKAAIIATSSIVGGMVLITSCCLIVCYCCGAVAKRRASRRRQLLEWYQ